MTDAAFNVVTRHYCDGPFGQVHYRQAGSPTSPCLLFLHQTPSNSVMFEALMNELHAEFFCLAPDNPGFGGSDAAPRPNNVGQYADSAMAVLDHLDIPACAVFGHHSGAGVGVQLEVDHPARVSKLALSGPPLVTEEVRQALLATATDLPPRDDGSHLQAMWARIRGKARQVPLRISQRETTLALQIGTQYGEAYRAVLSQPFGELLPKVSCPVLLMAGGRDVLRDSLEPCAQLVANNQVVVIDDAATYVCEQDADRVAIILREFLAND
jgi:pimeloyl-ACP methyl ester carboxylesterase